MTIALMTLAAGLALAASDPLGGATQGGTHADLQRIDGEIGQLKQDAKSGVVEKDHSTESSVSSVGQRAVRQGEGLYDAGSGGSTPAGEAQQTQARGQAEGEVSSWKSEMQKAQSGRTSADEAYEKASDPKRLDEIDHELDGVIRRNDIDRSAIEASALSLSARGNPTSESVGAALYGESGPNDLSPMENSTYHGLLRDRIQADGDADKARRLKQELHDYREAVSPSGAIGQYHQSVGRKVDEGQRFVSQSQSEIGQAAPGNGQQFQQDGMNMGKGGTGLMKGNDSGYQSAIGATAR